MSGFSGADVAQLRALSGRINTQSEKLREIAASSTVALMAAEWTGNDIDAVRSNWRRGSLPTIDALASALREMSAELDKHAAEQERVSGGSSGSASWADVIKGWFEGWLQRLVPPVMPFLGFGDSRGGEGGALDQDNNSPSGGGADPGPSDERLPEKTPGPGSTSGSLPGGAYDQYLAWTKETRRFVNGHWEDAYGNWERNCTSWADYRRAHLDPPLATVAANGGEVAETLGGSASTPPSLGAAVSYYPPDSPGNGHVMVVEEIRSTDPPTVRVSEDNYAGGYRDSRIWTQQPNGLWSDGPGRPAYALEFSPPGK